MNMIRFSALRSRIHLAWVALTCAWLATLILAVGGSLIGDEWVHWHQIQRFVRGDYRVFDEWLTNIPGYHWLLTAMLVPFGVESLAWVRAITALMTLLCGVSFFLIRRQLHPADAARATAQFLFLPSMFVYGYMAYTDVPALMFLLAAMLATLRERHLLSAVLLLCSMAIRQNNVLWVVFLALYAIWPLLQSMWQEGQAGWRDSARWCACFGALLQRLWPYALAVLCFCAYWVWNGSIAYSTAQSMNAHPDVRLDIGNPIYLLAMSALLFPLQISAGWKRLLEFGLRWRGAWIWLLPLAVFALYALLFKVHHPFNFIVDGNNLRNLWLQRVATGGPEWWLFGALASWGFGGLLFQRYSVAQGWLWLPFSLLFIAASWMIETRYTIVPFVMFLLLRRPQSRWVESATLGYWAVLSLYLAGNVFPHRFAL